MGGILAGCLSPEGYESEPVQLQTAQGPVICQLYTRDRALWDRAIHRPQTMTVQTADAIRMAEGERQLGRM